MTDLPWVGALVAALVVLLVGEFNGKMSVRAPAKVIASTAFLGLAFTHGSLDGPTGGWLLAALCLCWMGDVLLLGSSRALFVAGLVVFLAGHLAFVGAFAAAGLNPLAAAGALVLLAGLAVPVFRWLRPNLPPPMLGPVVAYMVVISLMVAGAVGRVAADAPPRILLAALMFYVSDLAVARNRFVSKGPMNRLWGLPLYYGAMVLLALGV